MLTIMRYLCGGFVATLLFLVTHPICNAGPIHDAVKTGELSEVVRVLDLGTDVNERMEDKKLRTLFTPLHIAVWEDKMEIARELIKRGADVKVLDHAGRNPLFGAAYNGNSEMIQLLLDNGVKDIINEGSVYNTATPLCIAMNHYYRSVARLLIMNGADVNIRNANGKTAADA